MSKSLGFEGFFGGSLLVFVVAKFLAKKECFNTLQAIEDKGEEEEEEDGFVMSWSKHKLFLH